MPNNLMVLQDAWHWRKATYWDMPKCATCEHWDKEYPSTDKMCNHEEMYQVTSHSFGCVYHSSIAMPEVLHTPTEPLD